MTSKPTTTAIPPHVTAVKPVTASTLQVIGGVGAARGNVGLGRSVPTAASLQGHTNNKTGGTGKVLPIPNILAKKFGLCRFGSTTSYRLFLYTL